MLKHTPNEPASLLAKQTLIDDTLTSFLSEIDKPSRPLPLDIDEALSVIHERLFDSTLNVQSVRRQCGIKSNNISARFRTALGVGLREYIERRRIEASKRLLLHATLEVYLIAQAVGYNHAETFFRAFQRRKDACTPQRWRERYRDQPLQGSNVGAALP